MTTVNQPLQARAGRNSPKKSLAPEFNALLGIIKRLTAAAAPGVTIKIAEGGPGFISPTNFRAFIGANVGVAELILTLTIRRDSDGAIFETIAGALGPGANDSDILAVPYLPEGFSLWLNTVLDAGAYADDAEAQYTLAETESVPEGPVDLTTSLQDVVVVADGHTKLLGLLPLFLYNRDSIAHDIELYLSNVLGNTLIGFINVLAGAAATFPLAMVLNSGETIKARIPVAIATDGSSVTVMGMSQESNLINT